MTDVNLQNRALIIEDISPLKYLTTRERIEKIKMYN